MATKSDPERGPEGHPIVDQFEAVRSEFEPELDRVAEMLNVTREFAGMLAVIHFARHLDMTNDPNTVVLVVRGTLDPYDTAMQAMIGDGQLGEALAELFAALEGKK